MSCNHLNCNLKVSENNKCIFHCEKDGWFELNDENKKIWDESKVNEFWSELNTYVGLAQKKEIETNILGKLTSYGNGSSKEIVTIFNFIIPKLDNINNISEELKYYYFDECTFIDDFVIDLKLKDEYLKIDFNFSKSTFKGKLEFKGDSSGIDGNIKICCTKHYDDIKFEADYFKYTEINNINHIQKDKDKDKNLLPKINIIFSPTLVVRHLKFENLVLKHLDKSNINNMKFWYTDITNFIANRIFDDYVDINNFLIKDSIINNFNLKNFTIKEFKLQNITFRYNSKIDIVNIKTNTFIINQLSQNSEYINFDQIVITNKFECNQVNFKNTTFNNFNLIKCKIKNFLNTSFTNSYLNSIKWGNINQINSNRETFRQLKFLNDEKSNYIDANNFFVKEMKAYKKELSTKKWFNWWEEKVIFLMNEEISNFGKSWFQSLLWLFIITLILFNIIE